MLVKIHANGEQITCECGNDTFEEDFSETSIFTFRCSKCLKYIAFGRRTQIEVIEVKDSV